MSDLNVIRSGINAGLPHGHPARTAAHDELFALVRERQQAIDALREIAKSEQFPVYEEDGDSGALFAVSSLFAVSAYVLEVARAALLKLGEQP